MTLKKRLAVGVLLPLVLMGGCRRQGPESVILIVVDTLRADHLGFYGYDRPTSPGLDEWATQGRVFDSAFATSSWTLPTFGSVLTGLWPAQHLAGARLDGGSKKWRRGPLSSAVETLPEVLQSHGFTTGAIVNNAFLRERFGAARGFEFYDYEKGRPAREVVDLATRWLTENRHSPFFLMVHLIDPHLPYAPPGEFMGQFGEVTNESISTWGRKSIVDRLSELTEADKEALQSRYDEEIASVDHELSRLFRSLDEQGLWGGSLVVLTSDHGEEFFDHGRFEHGHSMFQEVLRVPLVIWGPGIRTGREAAPVSLADLAPTIYEATGVSTAAELAGTSLWDLLVTDNRPDRREILAQNTLWGREHEALIAWPYKLILDPRSGRSQLYDLSADPLETRDLAAERGTVVVALEERLRDRLAGFPEGSTEDEITLTEEMEEELRALGYLD